ncbi:MAG: hypothetical protein EA344_08645 [Alkalicoccus sp.]|nr:MAG: hypothetical protein EA344_08645 [Alkalicoccus sp.]
MSLLKLCADISVHAAVSLQRRKLSVSKNHLGTRFLNRKFRSQKQAETSSTAGRMEAEFPPAFKTEL